MIIRLFRRLASLAVLLATLGCSSSSTAHRVTSLDHPTLPSRPAQGWLEVRTDPLEWEDDTFTYFRHRHYDLYDASGEYVCRVRNHLGNEDESPARIALPAGAYSIRVATGDRGRVELDVVVEVGMLTTVNASSEGPESL